jgi:hypothetical protein
VAGQILSGGPCGPGQPKRDMWLARHHCTPTHASWLNQVEMTSYLKQRRHRPPPLLVALIDRPPQYSPDLNPIKQVFVKTQKTARSLNQITADSGIPKTKNR